ncbi:MAG: TetR/AcrR family transcriptional regulator [Lachnospiraceae bacterium]
MAEIRRILADSFKELVQEKGFQKIIVKDITDRAKVKRPTFYTYFRDKMMSSTGFSSRNGSRHVH